MEPLDPKQIVTIDFTNHRGEKMIGRRVIPYQETLRFGVTPWHPEACWHFDGADLDRGFATRTYSIASITRWEATPQESL